jgi:hypothetical protein
VITVAKPVNMAIRWDMREGMAAQDIGRKRQDAAAAARANVSGGFRLRPAHA